MTSMNSTVGATSIWQHLSNLKASLARRRTYRSTVKELSALCDRDLTDMGIHPADIHDIARQGAYGV